MRQDMISARQQRPVTLGELIRVVSGFSNHDHEVGLAVADLMQRGVVVLARPASISAMLHTVVGIHKN